MRIGLDGEDKVAAVLSMFGHKVERMPSNYSKFDIFMDGKIKIEVKTALPIIKRNAPEWQFNIHRHNQIDEKEVDFYIFRFEGIPGSKKAIHALIKPPLLTPTIRYSQRQLLEGAIAEEVKAFRALNLKARGKQSLALESQDKGLPGPVVEGGQP